MKSIACIPDGTSLKVNRFKQGKVPLERALSKLGIASRTQARKWIAEGLVSVNGQVKNNPLLLVSPEKDKFIVSGILAQKQKPVLILLNKPKGLVTTNADEKGRETVFSLLKPLNLNLHSVGRLDMATTGLLLLTNDTKISHFLTDPKNEIPRVYVATVKGLFTEEQCQKLKNGIQDEDGEELRANQVSIRKSSQRETHLKIELLEGKNREIRRMFLALGHEVTALKRIQFGDFHLEDLKPGEYRMVSDQEVQKTVLKKTGA